MKRYNKGNKVKTRDSWNNGLGTIIPKGSIVTVIYDNGRGVMCEYNGLQPFYEYEWLGEVVNYPPMKERILHFFRDIGDKYIRGYEELSSGLDALEKETRNNTIDEFIERLKKYQLDNFAVALRKGMTWGDINRIAEQMKGEQNDY